MRAKVFGAILAALVILGGSVAVVEAAGDSTTAACTPAPTVVDSATSQTITLTCEVPKPAPVTETVTVPGPTQTVTVTASPTPEPTPTASQTPTPTATQTPTATATPSPSSTPSPTDTTPAGEFPNTNTTGWRHTGVTLRPVKVGDTGPGWSAEKISGGNVLYVRQAGAVLDSLDIPMCVKVMANNVTIKRSRISCASYYTVNVSDPPTYYSGLTLTDDEIDGQGSLASPGIAVMANANATYTRLDVHGFGSSGPRLATGTHLIDSYIHGFVCAPGEHSAGTSANDGGTGIVISGNNIDISTGKDGCASAAASIYPDFGTYNGVTISGNRFAGGAYCLYTAQNTGKAVNVTVTGNTFARTYYPRCGQYGAAAQVAAGNGNTFTGNVYDDGTPVG